MTESTESKLMGDFIDRCYERYTKELMDSFLRAIK